MTSSSITSIVYSNVDRMVGLNIAERESDQTFVDERESDQRCCHFFYVNQLRKESRGEKLKIKDGRAKVL